MKFFRLATTICVVAYTVLSPLSANCAALPGPDAITQKLEQSDLLMRGKSEEVVLSMTVHTRSWERDYKFKLWTKGKDQSFARVLAPAKVAGQGYLRLTTRLWNYLPDLERSVLIPPSMMTDHFMGSDFSNDDMVKMSYFARDYDATCTEEQVIDGVNAYHLVLKPHPDAPVTYAKLELWLRTTDSAPLKLQFYNSKLESIRLLTYSNFRTFSGHNVPTVWKMENQKEPGRYTTITVSDAVYDTTISDSIFTRGNLTR